MLMYRQTSMSSVGKLAQQPARGTPFRSLGTVPRPRSQTPASPSCDLQNARKGAKLSALPERNTVNAATLETTETDLSAELRDVLSKVQPKVLHQSTFCKSLRGVKTCHRPLPAKSSLWHTFASKTLSSYGTDLS